MKVNPVKQFVRNNISRFEKYSDCSNRVFNLYDKNNVYRGEYYFSTRERFGGVIEANSSTRIMGENLKLQMQEFVCMNKDFVDLYDPASDDLLKVKRFPRSITTTITVLDYLTDKFKTVRIISKLKNELQRMGKDNPNFMYSDDFVIYEPLKEKPQYEKSVICTREGSISEVKKNTKRNYSGIGSVNQIPYRYW